MCLCRVQEVLGYGWVQMWSKVQDMTLEYLLCIKRHSDYTRAAFTSCFDVVLVMHCPIV